jgi:hypothetical protein
VHQIRLQLSVVVLAAACAACSSEPVASTSQTASDVAVVLAVPGAANANVSLAARGHDVVATWAATAGDATNIVAAVSHDGGVTFTAAVRVNDVDGDARVTGEQAPRVAIGRDIAIVWTSKLGGEAHVRLARSTDGGATYQPAITLHALHLTGARGWASIAADDDGVVHVAWLDGRDAMAGMTHDMAAGHGDSHAMHGTMRQDVFEATWRPDGSQSEVRLAENVCFCCKTSLSMAPHGTLYAAWRNIYPTNIRDMAVAASTDGGKSFSTPVRVSEDHWQIDACPEDGPSTIVTADGVLHIAWPTLLEGAHARKAIFYSWSSDGGRTFAPRVRVDADESGESAHPQLAAHGSGAVVVWEEVHDGHHVVFAREMPQARSGAVSPGPMSSRSGSDQALYPAIADANGTPVIAWTSKDGSQSTIHVNRK